MLAPQTHLIARKLTGKGLPEDVLLALELLGGDRVTAEFLKKMAGAKVPPRALTLNIGDVPIRCADLIADLDGIVRGRRFFRSERPQGSLPPLESFLYR